MKIEISHVYNERTYMIEEYNEGMLYRYIVLDADEMKELGNHLKKLGF